MPSIYLAIGHGVSTDGSWDPGCVDGNYNEAALMNPIAGAAVVMLRAHGVTVHTDYPDNDVNMTYSVRKANNIGVDAYVSLHCDYNKAPSGTLPIIWPGSAEGDRLANSINASVMAQMGIGTRGVSQRSDLYEVSGTNMPACIFETGSIRADISKLTQADAYGRALAYGILDYFGIAYNGDTPAPRPTPEPGGSGVHLERGDEGEQVAQLQRDLRAMAYEDEAGNELVIDGEFGPATEYAVRRLQSYHGIDVDGVYGPLSDAKLMSEIRKIQQALQDRGYDVVVDGAVGPITDRAIKAYQADNGLVVDGIVGHTTFMALMP